MWWDTIFLNYFAGGGFTTLRSSAGTQFPGWPFLSITADLMLSIVPKLHPLSSFFTRSDKEEVIRWIRCLAGHRDVFTGQKLIVISVWQGALSWYSTQFQSAAEPLKKPWTIDTSVPWTKHSLHRLFHFFKCFTCTVTKFHEKLISTHFRDTL